MRSSALTVAKQRQTGGGQLGRKRRREEEAASLVLLCCWAAAVPPSGPFALGGTLALRLGKVAHVLDKEAGALGRGRNEPKTLVSREAPAYLRRCSCGKGGREGCGGAGRMGRVARGEGAVEGDRRAHSKQHHVELMPELHKQCHYTLHMHKPFPELSQQQNPALSTVTRKMVEVAKGGPGGERGSAKPFPTCRVALCPARRARHGSWRHGARRPLAALGAPSSQEPPGHRSVVSHRRSHEIHICAHVAAFTALRSPSLSATTRPSPRIPCSFRPTRPPA